MMVHLQDYRLTWLTKEAQRGLDITNKLLACEILIVKEYLQKFAPSGVSI